MIMTQMMMLGKMTLALRMPLIYQYQVFGRGQKRCRGALGIRIRPIAYTILIKGMSPCILKISIL